MEKYKDSFNIFGPQEMPREAIVTTDSTSNYTLNYFPCLKLNKRHAVELTATDWRYKM